jgi:poly [ADP-ribose] polymerase 2/3/4
MAGVKAWKLGEPGHPPFPVDYAIVRRAVLQVTDLKTNHNKYYALELHRAGTNGHSAFRVFTHYGRTDDLQTSPDAGQKECRYAPSIDEADAIFTSIYGEKTSPRKGYREVALAASRIGSDRARGTSSGEVDAKTIQKLADAKAKQDQPLERPKALDLHPGVQELVRYVYAEATQALTSTVNATITANGIETPLGILTIGQVEKGESILARLYQIIQAGGAKKRRGDLEELSGEFYTVIPHRIGRARQEVASAIIDSVDAFGRKQETLQLMKDMLQVDGDASGQGSVLYDARVDQQYRSLKCHVGWLPADHPDHRQVASYVERTRGCWRRIKVHNVFSLSRGDEWAAYEGAMRESADNQRLLFHGSRIANWVGILSRGILLPKVAVSMGVRRTDAGWLGNGIYFGDAASTSCAYTSPGRKKTSLMAVARVALGRPKEYTKITYGLTAPPSGYDSCHGVRGTARRDSEFYDDEYVVYDTARQRLEYLVEFSD